MLKALLKWLGVDPGRRSLTVKEDRSGILHFGVPTEEDRKAVVAVVAAHGQRQKRRRKRRKRSV